MVEENPSLVWITCGTQFGLPLRDQAARQVLTNDRIVGIVGASAFNCGYAGLNLYEWSSERMEQGSNLGRKIVRFYGGERLPVT